MTLAMMMIIPSLNFVPTVKPVFSNFKYYGDTKPLGYFDPLKLSTDKP